MAILKWKSNKQVVAARQFTLCRITDLPDGSQKIELMPDMKTGLFVEVYLDVGVVTPPPPVNHPPVGENFSTNLTVDPRK